MLHPREDFWDWLEESSGYWPWIKCSTAVLLPYHLCVFVVFVVSYALMRTPRSLFSLTVQGFADLAIVRSVEITGVMCIANGILAFTATVFFSGEFVLWWLFVKNRELGE